MSVSEIGNQKTIEQMISETAAKTNERNIGELGKDDFLKLLVTQLKHQDPLQPVDDKEFIAQIAQFSALEQMQNMNQSFADVKAFSLIGKHVTATIMDDATGGMRFVEGDVTNVKMSGGKTYVVVDGRDVPVKSIIDVSEGSRTESSSSISPNTTLIGFNATGWLTDSKSGEMLKVTGQVFEIENKDNDSFALLDNVVVDISSIVTDNPSADPNFMTEYLEANKGNVIKIEIVDRITEKKVEVDARLREFVVGEDGRISAVMDEMSIPVSSIERVASPDGGLTLEQALLLEILEALTPKEQVPDDSEEDDSGEQTTEV